MRDENELIKSRERVRQNGEVFTPPHIVKEMMDLDGIKDQSYELSSTFLEPSCGDGNFLVEILGRKLSTASKAKSSEAFKLDIVKAVASIYGIDIQADNIIDARRRMLDMLSKAYSEFMDREELEGTLLKSVQDILVHNIILGNTLTGKMVYIKYKPRKRDKLTLGAPDDKDLVFREYNFDGENVQVTVYGIRDMDMVIKEHPPVNFMKLYTLDFDDTFDADSDEE